MYKDWDGNEKVAETFWEQEAEKMQNKETSVWVEDTLDLMGKVAKKPVCAVFGASGGIGKAIVPLLKQKYDVIEFDSSAHIDSYMQMPMVCADIVINLVTVNEDSLFENIHTPLIDKLLNVNLKGNMHVIQSGLRYMKEKGYGRIIYVSSYLSQNPAKGTALYSACKSFNDTLVKVVAMENAKHGVTVNSLLIGFTDFGLAEKVPDKIREATINKTYLKRTLQPQEICNAIDYLVNTEYVNGTALDLSGGLL